MALFKPLKRIEPFYLSLLKVNKSLKEQIQAFFYRKILEIRLHTPEKIPLQPAEVTGW